VHSSAAPAQQQQDPQAGAPAKKSRTAAAPAAPAAAAAAGSGGKALSSKEAEIAALRAQLEARQAEVKRLKQAQEADLVSVAVFGVSPRVPDTVLMAHFRSCADSCGANIKRCTMLAGRFQPHVTAPGAYLEFEGMGGDPASRAEAAQKATANALQLSGSMLLDQKITVRGGAAWREASRSFPSAGLRCGGRGDMSVWWLLQRQGVCVAFAAAKGGVRGDEYSCVCTMQG
jgi:hypothetical protein